MRKTIIFAVLFVMLTLLISCGGVTDPNNETTPPNVIRIGETFTDKQISVKVNGVRLVDNDIIVIDISITNGQSKSIGYSYIWLWGLLKTPENTQLENTSYWGNNNIPRFSGSNILPGVTIQDSISFDRYAPTDGKYTFYAEPPLPSDTILAAEKVSDFQVEFYYAEIEKE
jgi:hypothetical protein